jgi:hypothetical protein
MNLEEYVPITVDGYAVSIDVTVSEYGGVINDDEDGAEVSMEMGEVMDTVVETLQDLDEGDNPLGEDIAEEAETLLKEIDDDETEDDQ